MNGFKGILFDFNGTLLLDSPLHEEAWIIMAEKLRKEPLTAEEFRLTGHGCTNKAIITNLQGREPNRVELEAIVEEKESYYRKMCLQDAQAFQLARGVIPFLDALQRNGIPMTIATGSYPVNVDFYFQHLGLAQWFDRARVVLDDGSYPGKPTPDVFLLAAVKLQLSPSDCIVFEDSYMGIQAAYKAGVAKIIAVEPSLDHTKLTVPHIDIAFCDGFTGITIDYLNDMIITTTPARKS